MEKQKQHVRRLKKNTRSELFYFKIHRHLTSISLFSSSFFRVLNNVYPINCECYNLLSYMVKLNNDGCLELDSIWKKNLSCLCAGHYLQVVY